MKPVFSNRVDHAPGGRPAPVGPMCPFGSGSGVVCGYGATVLQVSDSAGGTPSIVWSDAVRIMA
ncbi:MAG: hypothetical protein CL406_02535 [Acidimicrobiaceae bacterium]|nr:hypothetical protein [Acidimicrobiaceae bacterium]